MVNETIINYLKSYMTKFPLEKLKSEILSKGYSEEEFNEALKEIKNSSEVKPKENKPSLGQIPFNPGKNKPMDLEKEIQEIKTSKVSESQKPINPITPQATQTPLSPSSPKMQEQPALDSSKNFKKIPVQHNKNKKIKNPNKKKGKVIGWILILIVLLIIGVTVANYFNISVFGFNIFRWLNFVPPF